LPLLTLLRHCTHEHHARLDAGIDFRGGRIRLERYSAFLRGVLSVVAPLESAMVQWLGLAVGPSRTECLCADLMRLDGSCAVEWAPVSLPRNAAEAHGCAYVLEGSTLGGLVLATLIEDKLGADISTSYLRLRGAATAQQWRAWLQRLETFGTSATADEVRAACHMACATFDAYRVSLRLTGALEEHEECSS
jgi:heme oxygenase (biliverdin-IX-beta and delta-forming)